jgi:hypothetical protein
MSLSLTGPGRLTLRERGPVAELGALSLLILVFGLLLMVYVDPQVVADKFDVHIFLRIDARDLGLDHHGPRVTVFLNPKPGSHIPFQEPAEGFKVLPVLDLLTAPAGENIGLHL